MGFNSLVSPGLNHEATVSASEFRGIVGDEFFLNTFADAGATDLDGRVDDRRAERARIARELHDTLLQGLFSVSMQLQVAVNHLPADFAAKPRFNDLVRLMSRVLEQGRLAVQGLRAPNDRGGSLGEALAGVPTELGLASAVGFRVIVEGRRRELRATPRD